MVESNNPLHAPLPAPPRLTPLTHEVDSPNPFVLLAASLLLVVLLVIIIVKYY